jgi:hypothetical protein
MLARLNYSPTATTLPITLPGSTRASFSAASAPVSRLGALRASHLTILLLALYRRYTKGRKGHQALDRCRVTQEQTEEEQPITVGG